MKKCSICKQDKPYTDFNKRVRSSDGLQTACKSCNQERSRAYYKRDPKKHRRNVAERKERVREENKRHLIEFLLENPCVDCGETDIVVLEFDHLRDKKYEVSSILEYRWETVLEEIAKCEVVCCNCHRRRTATRAGHYRAVLGV